MAQNVFMAQKCFLIPLRKLGKTYRNRFAKGYGQQIKPSFCAKKDEMLCQYINMDKHDFFFKSFPYNRLKYVFHKVAAEAFVVSFRLSKTKKQTEYFLSVFVKVDKLFSKTYNYSQAHGLMRQPSTAICTRHPSYRIGIYFYEKLHAERPEIQLIGEMWGMMDFKPHSYIRYWLNCLRYSLQEAKQLEYVWILDGVFDFSYQYMLCEAVHKNLLIIDNHRLYKRVKSHFKRYPEFFQLWLFFDNHDLNRFLFECKGNKFAFKDTVEFIKQWNHIWLMYYGTEYGFANEKDIFDGTSYADNV